MQHGVALQDIGWTTARQVINILAVVPVGFEATIFICQGSALTTRTLPVPNILVLKDHIQNRAVNFFPNSSSEHTLSNAKRQLDKN